MSFEVLGAGLKNGINNVSQGINSLANTIGKDWNLMSKAYKAGMDAGSKVGNATGNMSKANTALQGVGAGLAVGQFGVDIYNTIKQQQQAKEQLDLAKKNFNLELEKSQKQELAHNKLAASVDKAWGGEGKIADTIDYSQYKQVGDNLGGNGLNNGQNQGYIKDPYEDSRNQTTQDSYAQLSDSNANLNGSGNMPLASGASGTPVGYSDTLNTKDDDTQEEQDSNGVME